ncbi:response regulator transcription factor [Mangrovibacillus cuniculi]|uniref:Response regulator transcription factor n=1 Tax=Mangrovibacillus cuniculi TaxID=2593652 RepID=A0A7S8C9B4_9BACI|nr:response regulator transcription factor [Mangrovibacillus cuniculi]QPC45738.1 response regulator transcription factor [Mangrovibacillus cuniculi]
MIRILIVDDHEMVRLGVGTYLRLQQDMEVVAEGTNGVEAIELALLHKPDVILMDLVMDEMDGIAATKELISKWPEVKIMIMTSFLDDEKVYPALEAGATSYLLKTSTAAQIAEAIRKTVQGESVLEPEVTQKMMKRMRGGQTQDLHDELTQREMEILQLMTKGKSNQEIADECFITLKTVKTHVSNILSKLRVQDRTQAVIYAFQHGIVTKEGG